jgi:hypothetical protein
VVRTIERRATQRALTAAGLGGILAAGIVGITLSTPVSPAAAASGSTAFGVRASGTANLSADSGSLSDPKVSATGISTETSPGYAKASVGSLTVGGVSIGSVSATCKQGVTTVTHSGSAQETPFFHVAFGKSGGASATGVTVTITDAKGKVSETVRAAGVSCSTADTPPPTSEPPTSQPAPPTSRPTGLPTGAPTSKPGKHPTATTKPKTAKTPDKDATPVAPKRGHLAVTAGGGGRGPPARPPPRPRTSLCRPLNDRVFEKEYAMHATRSSSTSPAPRSPRRFASIDDQLGSRNQRYFGSGFKRVTHRITGAYLDPSTDLLRARARLSYPGDWSAKAAGKQLTPHLSTLDAAVVAVQLAELHLSTTFGLGAQQRRALWIRRLSIKAGAAPQEQLDDVALSVRRASTERHAATGVSRMEGRVGALSTMCEVVHDRDLRAARQTSDPIDADKILGDPARRYFGRGFQERDYDLRDVVVADDHAAVSATTRVSGDAIHPDGVSGKFQPAITFVDGMIVLAQLAQSLLYALDDIDRTASNTLWMRRVEISGPPPHQRLGTPFRTSTSVSRTAVVDFAGGRWRTSDWRAQFSGLTFSYRLAHELPMPREDR